MAIKKYYKFVSPRSATADLSDSRDLNASYGLYGNYTWYHRILQGSPSRLTRYREYDSMDADIDVARALDIIAEEIAGNNDKLDMPLVIQITESNTTFVKPSVVTTLNYALKTWCDMHDWRTRIFSIARTTIKYGDTFFVRPKEKFKKFIFTPAKNVVAAMVDRNDIAEVKGWHIKTDYNQIDATALSGQTFFNIGGNIGDANVQSFCDDDVIRFTLTDDMSDEAPFGESILRPIYRSFKQKELLEDSLIIYRVQRAPERRVFYIDIGKMPPHKVAAHLESIRSEIKQKKIPTQNGGQSTEVESIYNPQSMSEDFFFGVRSDGSGSRVETLPGGQGLGELSDLDYFYKKLWRGLRIPQSYIDNTAEGGSAFNDGKVGIAYIQEIKFSLYIERLQRHIEKVFDAEFKRFLHDAGIQIDPTIFKILLPQPSNFSKSRQQQIDNDLLGTYTNADGIKHLSKRFSLKKYLQLAPDEIIENERMLREEMGLNPEGTHKDLPKLYQSDVAESGGFEGGLGVFNGGPEGGTADAGDLSDEEADDSAEPAGARSAEAPPSEPETP